MKANVTKDSLLKALQHVLKAVSMNNPIPILTGIHIQAHENELILTASNTSMTIQYRIPQHHSTMVVHNIGAIVVPARYFYEIIRKCNDGFIIFETKQDFIFTITSGCSKVRLCGMDPDEFPLTNHAGSPSVSKLKINNTLLKSSIKQVATAASTSETRPSLTGVCFEYHDTSLHLMATDGIRLASRTIHIENQGHSNSNVIIPSKNLYEAAKILDGEETTTEIEVGANQIKFTSNNVLVQSVLIDGVYPSLKHVIPQSYVSEVIVETAHLIDAVERVTVLAGGNIIRIAGVPNKLELLSQTAEIGDIRDEVPLKELNGGDFIISLNGKFFMDTLRYMDSEYIRLKYTGKMNPIMIQPLEDPSSTLFLITPVRTAN